MSDLLVEVVDSEVDQDVRARDASARFAELLRMSPIPISLSRMSDGTIIDCNEAFLLLFGYLRHEVIGSSSIALGLFADAADRARAINAVLEQPSGSAVDVAILTRSGEIRRVRLWSEVTTVDHVPYLLTQLFDLTQVATTSHEVSSPFDLLHTLRSVFDSVLDGIVVQDAEGRIVLANPAAERILGLRASQIEGRTAGDPLWQARREDGSLLEADEHPTVVTLRTGCPITGAVLSVQINDQPPIWVSVTTRPIALSRAGVARGVVATFTDITERKDAEARLTHEATRDPLTGLLNRVAFSRLVDRSLQQAESLALLFLDLDGFKRVNDTYGHSAGDQLLADVGHRLNACLRASDSAARMGGDEFTIVLERTMIRQAIAVGNRILASLNTPFWIAGQSEQIGASIGIAISSDYHRSIHDLLKEADVALYRAKAAGKNQIAVYRHYST